MTVRERRPARVNIVMVSVTLLIILLLSVTGKAEENRFKSQGKIIFDNGTQDTEDDMVFDSGDFNKLAFVCR